jgi:hypothetical protein
MQTIQHVYFTEPQRETIADCVDQFRERQLNDRKFMESLIEHGFSPHAAYKYMELVQSTTDYE